MRLIAFVTRSSTHLQASEVLSESGLLPIANYDFRHSIDFPLLFPNWLHALVREESICLVDGDFKSVDIEDWSRSTRNYS